MKFVIKFRGEHVEKAPEYPYRTAFAVGMKDATLGMDDLDRIRSELEIPNLDPERVSKDVYRLYTSPGIKLPEHIARHSGHFKEGCSATAKVRTNALNQFVSTQIEAKRDLSSGAVENVKLMYVLDEEAVIDAWQDAGFPLEWDLQEPDKDES